MKTTTRTTQTTKPPLVFDYSNARYDSDAWDDLTDTDDDDLAIGYVEAIDFD